MWEKALIDMALESHIGAMPLMGDTAFIRMKRQAVINAARTPGNAHLARVQWAFPGVALAPLIEALRVKVAVMRLEGRL